MCRHSLNVCSHSHFDLCKLYFSCSFVRRSSFSSNWREGVARNQTTQHAADVLGRTKSDHVRISRGTTRRLPERSRQIGATPSIGQTHSSLPLEFEKCFGIDRVVTHMQADVSSRHCPQRIVPCSSQVGRCGSCYGCTASMSLLY